MSGVTLPYRTDWGDMLDVLDYAKGSGADRSSLDARFGAGEALRETLNALEELRLAARDDAGGVRLTTLGDRLAYAASPREQRDVLVEALLGYLPYRIPLERALAESMTVMDAPWVEHVWQVDMRLGQPRNRVEEARTFFFRIADAAGLGTYRRGVRGQATRLELAGDFAATIQRILGDLAAAPGASGTEEVVREGLPEGWRAELAPVPASGGVPATGSAPESSVASHLSITMTVDFSEWDLERIAEFLRLVGYPGISDTERGSEAGEHSS